MGVKQILHWFSIRQAIAAVTTITVAAITVAASTVRGYSVVGDDGGACR